MSSALSNAQKDKISQFTGVTGSTVSAAVECMKATNWSLERAIDHFYVTGMNAHPSYNGNGRSHKSGGVRSHNNNRGSRIDRAAIKQLYSKYADPNNDKILAEGIIQFCTDIGITPDDVVMLVLAERMGADVMGEISKDQFENGLVGLMLDSLEKIKAALPSLRAQVLGYGNTTTNNNNAVTGLGSDAESRSRFKEIYNFAYLLSRENGQKCVQQDMALEMWSLLLPPQRWPLIHHWCAFLKETHNRAISRDTWVQLVEFIENVPQDGEYSAYDDSGAWPYLVDEFVAWYRQKKKGGDDDGGVERMVE